MSDKVNINIETTIDAAEIAKAVIRHLDAQKEEKERKEKIKDLEYERQKRNEEREEKSLGWDDKLIVPGDIVKICDGSWNSLIEPGSSKISHEIGLAMRGVNGDRKYTVVATGCSLPQHDCMCYKQEDQYKGRKNNIILRHEPTGRIVFTNVRFCQKLNNIW